MLKEITFIANPIAAKSTADYADVMIDVKKALKSFQLSMFSFEVMHKDGSLRDLEDLNDKQRSLRRAVFDKILKNEPLTMPVAGVGINDNFELGSGRDVFMALAAKGWTEIPVHVRIGQQQDLEKFIIE